jgi:hypothetical protein
MSAIDIARGLTQLRPDWNIDGPYQFGEVGAVGAHGANTVDVYLGGSTLLTTGLYYLASYAPQVNDPVMIGRMQGSSRSAQFVLGKLGGPATSGSVQKLAAPASSVTFSAVPAGYTSLRLTGYIASVASSGNIELQFNGDTAAHYDWEVLYGGGQAPVSAAANATTYARVGYMSSTAVAPTAFDAVIVGYSLGVGYTVGRCTTARWDNFSNLAFSEFYTFDWRSSAVVTSLTITAAGNMGTGTTFSLYGVP